MDRYDPSETDVLVEIRQQLQELNRGVRALCLVQIAITVRLCDGDISDVTRDKIARSLDLAGELLEDA